MTHDQLAGASAARAALPVPTLAMLVIPTLVILAAFAWAALGDGYVDCLQL